MWKLQEREADSLILKFALICSILHPSAHTNTSYSAFLPTTTQLDKFSVTNSHPLISEIMPFKKNKQEFKVCFHNFIIISQIWGNWVKVCERLYRYQTYQTCRRTTWKHNVSSHNCRMEHVIAIKCSYKNIQYFLVMSVCWYKTASKESEAVLFLSMPCFAKVARLLMWFEQT